MHSCNFPSANFRPGRVQSFDPSGLRRALQGVETLPVSASVRESPKSLNLIRKSFIKLNFSTFFFPAFASVRIWSPTIPVSGLGPFSSANAPNAPFRLSGCNYWWIRHHWFKKCDFFEIFLLKNSITDKILINFDSNKLSGS